jgi:hypothetical protein
VYKADRSSSVRILVQILGAGAGTVAVRLRFPSRNLLTLYFHTHLALGVSSRGMIIVTDVVSSKLTRHSDSERKLSSPAATRVKASSPEEHCNVRLELIR